MAGSPVVLGIESSCDETGAGLVRDGVLLGQAVASSMDEHARYGGVVPEIAARAHLHAMAPVVDEALQRAGLTLADVGAVAVTTGPGLAGALQIGVAAAKAYAFSLGVPLYGVHHLAGHVAAATLDGGPLPDPCVVLIVSGGHTSLLLVRDLARDPVVHLGDTLDDAAGECFDKVARILRLPYPGGPAIDRAARDGDRRAVRLPRPLSGPNDPPYAFSFSGLKTAAARWVEAQRAAGDRAERAGRGRRAPGGDRRRADPQGRQGLPGPRDRHPGGGRRGGRQLAGAGVGRAALRLGRDRAAGAAAAAVHRQRGDGRGRR